MTAQQSQPSATMREYLAEIYRLQEDSPTVSTTSLADRLHVSAPAVPRMLKRLKSAGFVKHVPYQGVELTPLGREEALRELRRHRVLERFLVDVMGFTWSEAHDHADDLGQGLNDMLVERMFEMTGRPTNCPHGEPIPTITGDIPDVSDVPLVNASIGYTGRITRVRTRVPDVLDYLADNALVPNTQFEVVGRAPFNGPLSIRIGRETVTIGAELAQTLWVVPT